MANQITFTYESVHNVVLNNGLVGPQPALPNVARLYVIFNNSTERLFYVGTADSVQNRFEPRWSALREMGVDQDALDEMKIWVVQIQINGGNYPPHLNGVSTDGVIAVDVEHLLIRTYVAKLERLVRNVAKWNTFTNTTGSQLNWNLVQAADVNIPGFGRYNYSLPTGGSF